MSNEELHHMLMDLRSKHKFKITFFTQDLQCGDDPLKTLINKTQAGIYAISVLPLDDMPLHINDDNFEVGECAKWRLANAI
jgi:hypothetical protein